MGNFLVDIMKLVLVISVHIMEEPKLTGNHLKGLRPLMTEDLGFTAQSIMELV